MRGNIPALVTKCPPHLIDQFSQSFRSYVQNLKVKLFVDCPQDRCKVRCINEVVETEKFWYSTKYDSKMYLILPSCDTCVKSQGGFYSQPNDEDKPLLVFQNSMSFGQKLNLITNQKIFYSRKTELSAFNMSSWKWINYARPWYQMPASLSTKIFPILKNAHIEFQPLIPCRLSTI